MNCNTPTTGGTSNQNICWGVQDTDISSLPDLDQVPTGNTSNGIPTGQTNRAYLPSDQLSGLQCAHDTDAYYVTSSISTIPSPYLTNGSRNPGYYQTTPPSSNNNALADFDGRNNTNKILTVRGNKDYSSWRPHVNGDVDYPAASCCDIFYTEGTQQGDWYLPACGELGYILPPFNKINEAITNIRDVYCTSVGVTLDTSYHWSSTESDDKSRTISMGQGLVYPERKEAVYNVRAWLRVLPNMEVVRN